jgi:ABC-type sugar transport system substrate-binding protein
MTDRPVRNECYRRRAVSMSMVGLVVLTLVAAACGSSSRSSTSPSSDSSATASLASTSGSAAGKALAAAEAVVNPSVRVQAPIGITAKLNRRPPNGKTVYWLEANVAVIQALTPFIKQATTALDWNLKIITYTYGDATSLISAIEEAVAAKANFISFVAAGLDTASPAVAQAKAANIPVYEFAGFDNAEGKANGIYADVVGPQWEIDAYSAEMDYSVVQHHGPAGVLFVGDSTKSAQIINGSKAGFRKVCPTCDLQYLSLAPADLSNGSAPGQIVSILQREPKITNVVVTEQSEYTGLPQALDAAGMKEISIQMADPDANALQGLQQGILPAVIPFTSGSGVFAMVDAMARDSIGQFYNRAQYASLPFAIWTEKVHPNPVPVTYGGPPGFQQSFEKLWGVSTRR